MRKALVRLLGLALALAAVSGAVMPRRADAILACVAQCQHHQQMLCCFEARQPERCTPFGGSC